MGLKRIGVWLKGVVKLIDSFFSLFDVVYLIFSK
jgi:hypothetical protein